MKRRSRSGFLQIVDVFLPQMVEHLLDVPKMTPQDRILQQTVKQIADRSEAKRTDLAEAEKSLAALMASQAVSKSSYTQVASDHEASGRAFTLKALAEATQVLRRVEPTDRRTDCSSQVLLCKHRQILKDSIW